MAEKGTSLMDVRQRPTSMASFSAHVEKQFLNNEKVKLLKPVQVAGTRRNVIIRAGWNLCGGTRAALYERTPFEWKYYQCRYFRRRAHFPTTKWVTKARSSNDT